MHGHSALYHKQLGHERRQTVMDIPVNACDDAALRKGRSNVVLPEPPVIVAIMMVVVGRLAIWRVEAVVEGRDQQDEVRGERGDLVKQKRLRRVAIAGGDDGIVCHCCSGSSFKLKPGQERDGLCGGEQMVEGRTLQHSICTLRSSH